MSDENTTREFLSSKAYHRKLYVTDGFDYIRTEPTENKYRGFIKVPDGESKVSYRNKTLLRTLFQGHEISRKEYERAEVEIM